MENERVQEQDASLTVRELHDALQNMQAQMARAAADVVAEAAVDATLAAQLDELERLQMSGVLELLDGAEDVLAQSLDPDEVGPRLDELVDVIDEQLAVLADVRQDAGHQGADVQQVIKHAEARLDSLRRDAAFIVSAPGAEAIDSMRRACEGAAWKLRPAGPPATWDFANAVLGSFSVVSERIADPGAQLEAIKGMLMEAILANTVRAQIAATPAAKRDAFVEPDRVVDRVNGKFVWLGDGMLPSGVDQTANHIAVAKLFETKAGGASARELNRRREDPSMSARAEAARALAESGHAAVEGLVDRLSRQRELTGQLEATKARVETGSIYIDGRPYTVDKVQVVAVLPLDVATRRRDVLRLDVRTAELEAMAKSLQKSLQEQQHKLRKDES
jgi:hypothetical protein